MTEKDVLKEFRKQDEYIADIYRILQSSFNQYQKDPREFPNPMTSAVIEVFNKYKIKENE